MTVPNQSLLLWNFNEKLGGVFIKEHQSIAVLNQSFLFILLVLTMIFFFPSYPDGSFQRSIAGLALRGSA